MAATPCPWKLTCLSANCCHIAAWIRLPADVAIGEPLEDVETSSSSSSSSSDFLRPKPGRAWPGGHSSRSNQGDDTASGTAQGAAAESGSVHDSSTKEDSSTEASS